MAKIPPREVPSRDDYYMGMAFWISAKSKDPNTQMGAIIISPENQPLGHGYNGPPSEISDTDINWARPDKYDYIEHAEENAIDFSTGPLKGATIYVTGKPCIRCMRKIVKKKIAKVVYFNFKPTDNSSMFMKVADLAKADEIAALGKLELIQYSGNLSWMRDRMEWMQRNNVFD
jgi:dCMP deaminase